MNVKIDSLHSEVRAVLDPQREKEKFSENLVKQLIRQGEDRKTSIEETKMLQNAIDKVKLTQKKQRETILRIAKGMKYLEQSQQSSESVMTRLRNNMSRVTASSTSAKCKSLDVVMQEDFVRLKERINNAFEVLMQLHEETINRDSVLAELLLDTQMGKNNRMICKNKTHD